MWLILPNQSPTRRHYVNNWCPCCYGVTCNNITRTAGADHKKLQGKNLRRGCSFTCLFHNCGVYTLGYLRLGQTRLVPSCVTNSWLHSVFIFTVSDVLLQKKGQVKTRVLNQNISLLKCKDFLIKIIFPLKRLFLRQRN